MADDIKIKLGLDVGQLFTDLSKVTTQLNQVAVSADKAETEIKQLDAQKVDIDTSGAKSALDNLASDAGKTGLGISDTFKSALNPGNLTSGIVGGIAGGLASAGIGTAISAVQGLGTAIFEGAVRADEFGDKLEVAFKQQGIADVEGEINKVRESTLQLANDLGLPTQRTRELAGTVATLGGVSGKQAEDLTKLSAGIETFTDGTVKGEAVVKAFSRGLADPEGAAAIESLSKKYPQLAETLKSTLNPTEKLAAANKILGTSFETVAAQQSDAGGTFNKLSNTVNEAFETIGSGLNNALNALIPIFTESLGPAFSTLGNTISELFTRIWSVLEPILGLIGGAIMVNIVGMISVAVEALNTIYETAVYAFDQIMIALAPVFDAIKSAFGMDGAVGEGVDAMGILQNVLDGVTAVIGVLFDVIGNIAKVIVDIFVAALKLAIEGVTNIVEGIKSFISFIGDLILKIPGVSSVFKGLKSAFDDVYNFFSDLPKAINEVQVYLKAIGMTFQTVFNVLRQAFDDVLKLDFSSAGTKLASIFDSNNWSATFSAGLQKARSEIKLTGDAAKTAKKELNEFDNKNKGGGGGGGGGKGGGGKSAAADISEFKKASEAYSDYLDEIETKRKEAIDKFESQGLNKEEIQIKLSEDPSLSPKAEEVRAKIKDLFKTTYDENGNLQLGVKFGKDEDRGDATRNIRKLIADADKFEVNIPIKIDLTWRDKLVKELAEYVKDAENIGKNYSETLSKLFTNPVKTKEDLDKAENDFTNFNQMLIDQQLELENKIQLAKSIGDEKSLESLNKMREANQSTLDDMYRRYVRFAEDSAKEIEKNSGLPGAILTLQSALNDAFNIEKIRKERETNEKIRQERRDALNNEESDLMGSLAKREISFDEYQTKLAKIAEDRQTAMEETETTFMERMKGVLDQTVGNLLKGQSSAISGYVEDQFKNTEGKVSETGKIIGNLMGNLATQFGELALSGKATLADFARSSVLVAYQALQQMIPIFIAEIAGKQFAELGLLGLASAAALTIALNGLFALAAPSLGFKDGVVELNGPGTETSDSIPAWLSKGESVITAAGTRANKEELAWMNANPGMSIRDYFASQAPQVRYSVSEDGNLIQEVRKLREETRGLGKQISRNTKVEVSGALIADNNSIKAVIEADRRRNARRG